MSIKFAACTVAALLLPACAVDQLQPAAEISDDRLQRVTGSSFDEVWVRPGMRFAQYREAVLEPVTVSFREVDEDARSELTRNRSKREAFPLSSRERERIEDSFRFRVEEALDQSKLVRRVESPGVGVMQIRVELVDFVSTVPPLQPLTRSYVRFVGGAVMQVELRDSATGELLARAMRHDKAGPTDIRVDPNNVVGSFTRGAAVTGWADVNRQLGRWASEVVTLVDGLYGMEGA